MFYLLCTDTLSTHKSKSQTKYTDKRLIKESWFVNAVVMNHLALPYDLLRPLSVPYQTYFLSVESSLVSKKMRSHRFVTLLISRFDGSSQMQGKYGQYWIDLITVSKYIRSKLILN